MKKISTLFKKDPNDLGIVTSEAAPENSWVFEGDAIATRKFDGIACAIIEGQLYKRFDVKKGRVIPENAIACQGPDEFTGHHPHWIPCNRNKPEDKYFYEALDSMNGRENGTYELCGEKISTERFSKNLNVEKVQGHKMIKHGSEILNIPDLSFEGLKSFLEDPNNDIEGIVFHHKSDGRMCKLRKKDFKIKR